WGRCGRRHGGSLLFGLYRLLFRGGLLCLFRGFLRGLPGRLLGFLGGGSLCLFGLGRLLCFLLFLRCHVIHSMVCVRRKKLYASSRQCASDCIVPDGISFA